MSDRRQVRLIVTGRVQGVFFRDWTVGEATRLGLDGWVRNRRDGAVEIVAAGPPAVIEAFVALCHHGPPAAAVDRIEQGDDGEAVSPGFRRATTV